MSSHWEPLERCRVRRMRLYLPPSFLIPSFPEPSSSLKPPHERRFLCHHYRPSNHRVRWKRIDWHDAPRDEKTLAALLVNALPSDDVVTPRRKSACLWEFNVATLSRLASSRSLWVRLLDRVSMVLWRTFRLAPTPAGVEETTPLRNNLFGANSSLKMMRTQSRMLFALALRPITISCFTWDSKKVSRGSMLFWLMRWDLLCAPVISLSLYGTTPHYQDVQSSPLRVYHPVWYSKDRNRESWGRTSHLRATRETFESVARGLFWTLTLNHSWECRKWNSEILPCHTASDQNQHQNCSHRLTHLNVVVMVDANRST